MLLVKALPSAGVDRRVFFDAVGKQDFGIFVNAETKRTYLWFESPDCIKRIRNMIPGFEAESAEPLFGAAGDARAILAYRLPQEGFDIVAAVTSRVEKGSFGILFLRCGEREASTAKEMIEGMLGTRAVKATAVQSARGRGGGTSLHMDLFTDSEERRMMLDMLEDANTTLLSGRQLYKVFFVAFDSEEGVRSALSETAVMIGETRVGFDCIAGLFSSLKGQKALAFGTQHASCFVGFIGAERLNYAIETFAGPESAGGIALGRYAMAGVAETEREVTMPRSSLNLGMIISGVPGSGKTCEAMAIIRQTMAVDKPAIVVISPTNEWNAFAAGHAMHLIEVGKDYTPINFFANPKGTSREKFYEDLALLLSSASNSGPYRNPMEKCLLNAFRLSGRQGLMNPTEVYDQIEESIIRLHGKKTNVGVKYTKHGENIKAALENLRHILSHNVYSVTTGVQLGDMAKDGVVFNLAGASNNAKPYFYALLLNQFYALADMFDDDGDDELRMLICIEEAQTIFMAEKESAASMDLTSRIQDFRKKGVGIMLLTHSITDITPEIRRMCQNKIYMKQAPDIAAIAAKDLVFTYAEQDEVVAKLKHLDSRLCAVNFVAKSGDEKLASDSVFLITKHYKEQAAAAARPSRHGVSRGIRARVTIEDKREGDRKSREIAGLAVSFLGEGLCNVRVAGGAASFSALEGRLYSLVLVAANGKQVASMKAAAHANMRLVLDASGLHETK